MIKPFLMRATSSVLIAALGVFVLLPNACYCSVCECAAVSLLEKKDCCLPSESPCDCCHQSESRAPSGLPESPTCQCQPLTDPFIVPSADVLLEQSQASFLPTSTIDFHQHADVTASSVDFAPLILRSDQPLFIAYCRWLI